MMNIHSFDKNDSEPKEVELFLDDILEKKPRFSLESKITLSIIAFTFVFALSAFIYMFIGAPFPPKVFKSNELTTSAEPAHTFKHFHYKDFYCEREIYEGKDKEELSRIKLLRYEGKNKKVKIPDEIGNEKVYCIASSCFLDTNIEEVIMSKNIRIIESYAFHKTHLKEITFFYNPDGLVIKPSAFSLCKELTSLYFPHEQLVIGANAFEGCSNLQEAEFIKGKCALVVGIRAFANTGLTGIRLPRGTKLIDKQAFYGCNALQSKVIVPEGCVVKEPIQQRKTYYRRPTTTATETSTTKKDFTELYTGDSGAITEILVSTTTPDISDTSDVTNITEPTTEDNRSDFRKWLDDIFRRY